MTTHTPPNWIIETSRQDHQIKKNGFVIAEVTGGRKFTAFSSEEGEANARLIAAAPQMYELLTQVRNYTHEPLPEELQKEIAHVLYTINTKK